jgi:hypothetical protein
MLNGKEERAFLKKGAPKTFVTFTRGVSRSPGEQKFFAELFLKKRPLSS